MADLTNTSAETLAFSEVGSKGIGQSFSEAIELHTFQTANPYFFGADLGIYSEAMTSTAVAEFMRSRGPIGYSRFRDFVAGEYKFQRALVDFVFKPLDGADARLSLVEASIYADVPDRSETDAGTVTNATTGLSVTFSAPFSQPPKVTVTPVSAATPVVAVLTASPTTTGFTVKLYNLSGTAVTGSFIWTALGY